MTNNATDAREQKTLAAIEGSLLAAYCDSLPAEYSAPTLTLTQAMMQSLANYERFAKRHGLTTNGMLVLMTIRFATEPCTQRLISKVLWLPKQTVGSIVNAFKKKGYLTEKPSPHDGRAKMLALTEEGAAFSDAVLSELSALERTALEETPRADMEVAVRAMSSYADAFERGIGKLEAQDA